LQSPRRIRHRRRNARVDRRQASANYHETRQLRLAPGGMEMNTQHLGYVSESVERPSRPRVFLGLLRKTPGRDTRATTRRRLLAWAPLIFLLAWDGAVRANAPPAPASAPAGIVWPSVATGVGLKGQTFVPASQSGPPAAVVYLKNLSVPRVGAES